MSSARSSPSPPSDTPDHDGPLHQGEGARSTISKMSRDASSLKRVREGSLEPNASGPTAAAPVTTKKNRLTSSGRRQGTDESAEAKGLAADSIAEGDVDVDTPLDGVDSKAKTGPEGKTVGEVRRKVEKMSYDEGQERKRASSEPTEIDEDQNQDQSWEKADKDETSPISSSGDGLKRKALDRSESSFAQEKEDLTVKRQKDTPPPDGGDDTKLEAVPKKAPTSFSSFASSSSPFAALGGPSPAPSPPPAAPIAKKPQATFGSFARTSSPFAGIATSSTSSAVPSPAPPVTSDEKESVTSKKPQATFGAFTASSPFGGAKATSAFSSAPSKGSAFGNYSANASAFGTKKTGTSDAEKEAGPSAFGDILREQREDTEETEVKVQMQEKDVSTGEEEEETIYQTRAKLYFSDKASGAWKERGVGVLKLNVRRADALGARLVMRSDGVYSLLLNAKLYKGLNPHVDGKIVRMSIMQGSEFTLITLRMSSPKVAAELAEHILDHIPLEDATPQPESV